MARCPSHEPVIENSSIIYDPMYLWTLLFYLLSTCMSTFSRQSAQFCSSSFFSFSELCCQPCLLVFLSSIPPSNLHLVFNIWFHQSLSLPKSPSMHLAHLPTNCFSCNCSNSSHSNFLPPCLVQPVTSLL